MSVREVRGDPAGFNRIAAHILDFDGDAKAELFDGLWVLDDLSEYDPENAKGTWPILHTIGMEAIEVTVGDVDEDLRSDIVFSDALGNLTAIGMDTSNTVNTITQWPSAGVYGAITTANVDDDSPVLSYRGERELLYTDPIVLAVIAARVKRKPASAWRSPRRRPSGGTSMPPLPSLPPPEGGGR